MAIRTDGAEKESDRRDKNKMKEQMRIHFIKGKESDIAFFCDTLEIKKVTPKEREELEQQMARNVEYPPFQLEEEEGYFSTLILHISNACNMRCAYCFANHGTYGSKANIMTEQVALDAIEVFYKKYPKIKQIKFFGGEPLMNVPVMKAVCERVQEKLKQGEIRCLPEYKVVTNGTILPEEAMNVIRDHDIQVVFSIDGPEEIHDHARVMANGDASFAKIRENFFRLREYTGGKQPYGVEMTYTAVHRSHGLSMKDVTDYFVKNFDLEAKNVNISPVSAEDGSEYALEDHNFCMVQSAGEILEAKREGKDAELDQKLYFLAKKIKAKRRSDRQVCNAAWKWAAVSSTGDVYPCLMFMDRQEYKLGSIYEDLFHAPRYQKITEEWKHYDRYEQKACRYCFANNICINCMGQNLFATGNVYEKTKEQCGAMRALAEKVIEGIAEGVF